jgi:hypothetical protein
MDVPVEGALGARRGCWKIWVRLVYIDIGYKLNATINNKQQHKKR